MNIDMNNPKYIIVAQLFENDRTLFRLQDLNTLDFIEGTADTISLDLDIINSLSSTDAHLIGFVSASEKILSDLIKTQIVAL